jgi:hypothetical protein
MGGRTRLGQISEPEFASLLEALSATAKGRSFLAEYRRRSRPDETLDLLGSLRRIEAAIACVRDQLQPRSIADELLRVAMTLELAADVGEGEVDRESVARRFALVGRARLELLSLARSLRGEALPTPGGDAESEAPAIRLIDDERVFFDQLGIAGPESPPAR